MDGQHRREENLIRFLVLAAVTLASAVALAAEPYRLAPYKDDLFAYPSVLETKDDGAYVVVSYDKQRDLYGRDEVPQRQVRWNYLGNVRQRTITYDAGGKLLKAIAVGDVDAGTKAVVIYIHGQGGSRLQGADNGMFGGNFNRVMNLMALNGGAYLSPDFTDLGETGALEIKTLVTELATRSPGAAIFVACGSQGGAICWRLAADTQASDNIAGLLLLGSSHDDAFLKSPTVMGKKVRRLPIYIGHGTDDPLFKWEDEAAFYAKVRKASPNYPIRMVLFQTGVHGTPIRMTDWRLTLNWMLEVNGR